MRAPISIGDIYDGPTFKKFTSLKSTGSMNTAGQKLKSLSIRGGILPTHDSKAIPSIYLVSTCSKGFSDTTTVGVTDDVQQF